MMDLKSTIESYVGSPDHLAQKHVHPRLMKFLQMGGMNVAFEKAEGHYLFDGEGNRYLDMLSGGGVFLVGRNHPRVNQAVRDVLDLDLPNLCVVNASVLGGLLAEKLLELAGDGFTKVQYSNSGAEANEIAIRFARFCTRRRRFLYLQGAFHGRTYGAISLCGFPEMNEGMDPKMPVCTPIRPNDLAELRRELSKGDIAGFFLEPVQGMTLDVLDKTYLQEASRLCKEYGTLLIVDEIQTGLGRLGGTWFGYQAAGIVPDMVSVSKVLSGGQAPVAATLIGDEVYDRVFGQLTAGPLYFSTFAENNISMAAGIAILEVLVEMDAPKKATEISKKLRTGLNEIAARHDVIDRVAGKGLMLAVYFKQSEKKAWLKAQQAVMGAIDNASFGAAVNVELFTKHRTIVQVPGPGMNAFKILPPVTLSDEDIQYFLGALDDTLSNMYAGLGGPAVAIGTAVVKDAVKTVTRALPRVRKNGVSSKKARPAGRANS